MKLVRYLVPFFLLFRSIAFAAPDYSKPVTSTPIDQYAGYIRENVNAATKIDPSTGTSIPEGAIWYDYANKLFKRYESSSWVTKEVIPDASILFAKFQNIATDRLIGRDTASSGVPEEISLTNGLAFTGSTSIGISTGGVSAAMLASTAASRGAYLGSFVLLTDGGSGDVQGTFGNASNSGMAQVSPFAIKITHLSYAFHNSLSLGTGSIDAKVYVAGSPSGQSINIGTGTHTGYGALTEVAVTAGQTFYVLFTKNSSPTTSRTLWVHVWGRIEG